MGVFLRAYDRNGTALGMMPDFTDLQIQTNDNAPGTMTFKYLLDGVGANLLSRDELYLSVNEDGTTSLDLFQLEEDTDDPSSNLTQTKRRWITCSARGYLGVLDQAVVYPKGANSSGSNLYGLKPEYKFDDATPGNIILTLINAAKGRGALNELLTDFVTATDSAGRAWPKKYDITYTAGTNLLQVLTDMVNDGWVDVRTEGRKLRLFVPDTYFGVKSDVLRYGQNVLSAPRKRSRRGIFSHVLAGGDAEKKANVQVGNTATASRFGRREGYVADGRLTKTAALQSLANRELVTHQQFKEGFTLEMVMNPPGIGEYWPRPGIDFFCGDRIYYDRCEDSNGNYQPLLVRSISKSWGDTFKQPTCSIEVADLFVKQTTRTAQQVAAITNGSTGVRQPPPRAPQRDTFPPIAPFSVTVVGQSDLFDEGTRKTYRSKATITWPFVDQDSDGTPLEDLNGYEVAVSINGGPWSAARTSKDTQETVDGLKPNDLVRARVLAKDWNSNRSDWTYSDSVRMPVDTAAPLVPTTPILTQKLGVVTVRWDGKGTPGPAAMPPDFHHIAVQRCLSSTFDAGVIAVDNLFEPDATTLVTGLPYGETWYFRFLAIDIVGNVSVPSPAAYIAVTPLVDADLPQQVLDDLDKAMGDAYDAGQAAAAAQSTANAAATQSAFEALSTNLNSNYYTKTGTNTQISQTAATLNHIVYSTSDPSGTNYNNGDIWRKVDTLAAGGKIIGEWTFVLPGATWVTRVYSGVVLTALDAGSITAGTLDANRIAANSLNIGHVNTLSTALAGKETAGAAAAAQTAAIAAASLLTNKVNNPTRTGTVTNWITSTSSGAAQPLAIDTVDFNGVMTKTMKVTTTGDTQVISDYFEVDVTKAYEIRMWVRDPSDTPTTGNIQFYLGLNALDTAGAASPVVSVTPSTGVAGADNSNFYFTYTTAETATWREHVAYVFPYGATAADMKGLGTGGLASAQLKANTGKLRLRFLSWANAGVSRDLWAAHITVREMGIADLRAATTVESWRATGKTTIFGGAIETDTILATAIKANTIGAKQLLVGDMSNMAEIDELTPGLVSYAGATHIHETVSGVRWSKRDITTSTYFMFRNQHGPLPFKGGDRLRLTFDAFADANVAASPSLYTYGTTSPIAAFSVAPTPSGGTAWPTTITTAVQSFAFEAVVPALTDQTTFLIGLSGLVARDVRVKNVRAYRMNAGELVVDGSIEGKHIKAGTVDADRIIASTLTIGKVQDLSNQLAGKETAGAASAAQTAAQNYADNAYSGTKTRVNTWTFSGQTTIDGGQIQADTVSAVAIKAHTIGADQLIVGGATNLVPNGTGEWGVAGGIIPGAPTTSFTLDTVDKPTGLRGAFKSVASAPTYNPPSLWWDVEPESEFLFECWLKADKPNSRIFVELRDQDGNLVTGSTAIAGEASATAGSYPVEDLIVPTVWTRYSAKVKPAAGTTRMRVGGIYFNHANGTERTAVQSIALRVRGRGTGRLFVDGSIEAKHLKANTITANELAVGAVKSENIAVGVLSSNLVLDPGFEDNYPFTLFTDPGQGIAKQWRYDLSGKAGGSVYRTTSKPRSGWKRLSINVQTAGDTTTVSRAYSPTFLLEAGKTYRVNWYNCSNGSGASTTPAQLTVDALFGATESTLDPATAVAVSDGVVNPPYSVYANITPSTYSRESGDIVVAAGATNLYCALRFTVANTASDSWVYVDDVSVIDAAAGGAAELTSAGLRVFDANGDEATSLVANRANYFSVMKDGVPKAAIDDEGEAAFAGVAVTGDENDVNEFGDVRGFSVGGMDIADRLSMMGQGMVARGYFVSKTFGPIDSDVGLFEVGFVAAPGREYLVTFDNFYVQFNPGTASGATVPGLGVSLRYTTDGSAPTITSTAIAYTNIFSPRGGGNDTGGNHLAGSFAITGTAEKQVRILVVSGVGYDGTEGANTRGELFSYAAPMQLRVFDLGPYGYENLAIENRGGGAFSGVTAAPAPAAKKTYVSAWIASSTQTRRGSGSSYGSYTTNPTSYTGSTKMLAGYYSSSNANQYDFIAFQSANSTGGESGKTISQALSGATVSKVELYVKNSSFYSSSGGQQRFAMTTLTGMPSSGTATAPPSSTYTANQSFTVGQGKWITLPSAAASAVLAGGRVAMIGPGSSTSKTYYSGWANEAASSGKPQLRITYTR